MKCNIPENLAIQLTKNWRAYLAQLINAAHPQSQPINEASQLLFRGMRISLESLKELMAVIENHNQKHGEQINSVRMYLAKDSTDINNTSDISTVFVPIVGGDKMPAKNERLEVNEFGKDLICLEDGQSTIYNYSSPCPKMCDINSNLYGAQ